MAWIESHQEIARHPKTKRLARELGISLPQAIGHLHLLWWWALDYAEDGDLSRYDDVDVADAAMWEGSEPAAFLNALHQTGWVDEDHHLHHWEEYAGRIIALHAVQANKEAQRFGGLKRAASAERDEHGQFTPAESSFQPATSQLSPATVQLAGGAGPATIQLSPAYPTLPDHTGPNRTGPEYERERTAAADAPLAQGKQNEKKSDAETELPTRLPDIAGAVLSRAKSVTAEYIEELVVEFAPRLGGEHRARDAIEAAQNHTAIKKAVDKRLYVKRWLARDVERYAQEGGSRADNGHRNGTVGTKPSVFAKFK